MAHSFDRGGDSRAPRRTRSRCKVFGLEQAAPSESPGLTSAAPLVAREFGEEISIGALSQYGGPAQFRYLIWRQILHTLGREPINAMSQNSLKPACRLESDFCQEQPFTEKIHKSPDFWGKMS